MILYLRFKKIDAYLKEKNTYYQHLSKFGRRRFVRRMRYFLLFKEFKGMYGLKITTEMIILISSAAIQITYRLREISISRVSSIHVFEKEFRLGSDQLFQGATISGQVLCVSWNNILRGFSNPKDNFNLALHEMTHALWANLKASNYIDPTYEYFFKKWKRFFIREMLKVRNNENNYFRRYGGRNLDEFFAVATECFFETPTLFAERNPELYLRFCILLNQDPLNIENNYHIRQSTYERRLRLAERKLG
jgi:Mlc titration factor MtfA (ptsG expression regulator)